MYMIWQVVNDFDKWIIINLPRLLKSTGNAQGYCSIFLNGQMGALPGQET